MNLPKKLAALIALCLVILTSSCNNSSGKEQADAVQSNQSSEPSDNKPAQTSVPTSSAEISNKPAINVNCAELLSSEMIETTCGAVGIKERISSIERKGSNCNRIFGKENAWCEDLTFIVSPRNDKSSAATGFTAMKKDNAANGLQMAENIGDGAFSLSFKDKLTGRKQEQFVFYKNNLLIELKTQESRSAKTPCPCFDAAQLKDLAKKIADKI